MYPIFLKLENKPCLVIGGGRIAMRKTLSLLDSGADITVISPDVTEELETLIESGSVKYEKRLYEKGDTQGYFLIIAATNSRESNKQVYSDALKHNGLINCVDDPEFCNFYVPAQVRRGSLKIAVSTEGKLPMLAGRIGRFLNTLFPDDIGNRLDEISEIRRSIIEEAGDDEEKKREMMALKISPIIDAFMEDLEK